MTASVKKQYEALPYPPRDPADEHHRLLKTVGDTLTELNHFCFNGAQTFTNNFRCLVAGGGTGDSAIYLADQLRDYGGQVTYLDLSSASRKIAEQRAAVRELTNITWLTGSLLDLQEMDLAPFDYINCSGVLHHLESPEQGLQALVCVLKENGAIFLMLYGKYGRHTVYPTQALLQEFIPKTSTIVEQTTLANWILDELPASNIFKLYQHNFASDLKEYGDSGLYDLLLHSVDRCYDVEELYDFSACAGLKLSAFLGFWRRDYQLERYFKDQELIDLSKGKTLPQCQAIAEKLSCDISKHQFYLMRGDDQAASIEDMDNCLILANELQGQAQNLFNAMKPGVMMTINYNVANRNAKVHLSGTLIKKHIFKNIHKNTSIKQIVTKVKRSVPFASRQKIHQEIKGIYKVLHPWEWLYLRK